MDSQAQNFITIVSGLPRSGTSLMMQMLYAGGLPALTDRIRAADSDNPRGYFEFEQVKQIKKDRAWLADARGRVVKMVHLLLQDLPLDRQYRVIMMRRDLHEVIASQTKMLQRSGKSGANLSAEQLIKVYESQLAAVMSWLRERPDHFRVFELHYADLIADPHGQSLRVAKFLESGLDVRAMAAAVDPELYRNRGA